MKRVIIDMKAWWPIYKLEEIQDEEKVTEWIDVPNEFVWRWDKVVADFEKMQGELQELLLKYAVGKKIKIENWRKIR